MHYRCTHCDSLFFRTLETRVLLQAALLLVKKRCKRCKYKAIVKKEIAGGPFMPASIDEWRVARKVSIPRGKMQERGRIYVGEYTSRVSGAADDMLPYLRKVRQAQSIQVKPETSLSREALP